ncbi:unnamed protein product [Linum trigynum]|uniref:Uncharacterized protein n=1 Tax=Linum trigynum TaxID=586398 RepID=A0AAV2CXD1_9ROSI
MGGAKSFCFEMAWLLHERVLFYFFTGAWNPDADLHQGLKDIASKIQERNKLTFGVIRHRKRRLLARFRGSKIVSTRPMPPRWLKLQTKLEKELDDFLAQEEVIWFKRGKENWDKFGEHNTSFFHQQANRSRRRNKILTLRDPNGNWVKDLMALRDLIIEFFTTLYTQE